MLPQLAAPGAPGDWTREPESVFGIALGHPFPAAGQVPDCPLFAPFRREPQYEGLCVDARAGFSADRLVLRNVPLSGLAEEAHVELRDGRVVAIVLPFEAIDFEPMKSLLAERYGPAHDHRAGGTPGASGAPVAETLAWRGARTLILLKREGAGRPVLEFRATPAP